jgi:hypothetical protein
MIKFMIGMFLGSSISVFYMCLLQAGHDDRDD